MGTGAANLDSGALKPSEGPALVARAGAYLAPDPRRLIQTLLGLIWLLDGALQFRSSMYFNTLFALAQVALGFLVTAIVLNLAYWTSVRGSAGSSPKERPIRMRDRRSCCSPSVCTGWRRSNSGRPIQLSPPKATSLRAPEPPTDFDQSLLLRFESLRRL
jgi:hypothetical protein